MFYDVNLSLLLLCCVCVWTWGYCRKCVFIAGGVCVCWCFTSLIMARPRCVGYSGWILLSSSLVAGLSFWHLTSTASESVLLVGVMWAVFSSVPVFSCAMLWARAACLFISTSRESTMPTALRQTDILMSGSNRFMKAVFRCDSYISITSPNAAGCWMPLLRLKTLNSLWQ